MTALPISQLPMVEEQDATGEVAEVYEDIKRGFEIPFVPNIDKALATSPNVLAGTWAAISKVLLETSLPSSLASMILYAVASANRCQYCSSIHNVTCRMLGIEEDTLKALAADPGSLNPRRLQEIINFAVKCTKDRWNLTEEDYARVRDQGVSDEEIIEIIGLVALGTYLDIIADSLKVEVDAPIAEALGG